MSHPLPSLGIMGYGGKLKEQQLARELRAKSWTLADIAEELGVSKSSVSVWVRDVEFTPNPRRAARKRGPNKLQRAKAAEIERLRADGIERVGALTEREFLLAGLGLYAGDGVKGDTQVAFANSNPRLIEFFCFWFRTFFDPEESRLRIRLYLHEDLPLEPAEAYWSTLVGVPRTQFHKTYRARADRTIRTNRHEYGCCHVIYCSCTKIREIKGLMEGMMLVPSTTTFRGSSAGRAPAC